MLAGELGPAAQKAMEIVSVLGTIYGADHLVPVVSAQVAGVSYKNLGEAGLEFLQEWAAQGAQVRVPATLNPAGMDLRAWQELGIPADFARRQQAVVEVYADMGVTLTCSCTPYLVGNEPGCGAHLAWSESSAVSYANSVLGARTNRRGGPDALAAAIVGRTACYGLHLEENRRATHLVEVRCAVESEADFGALGYLVGGWVSDGVPWFRGLTSLSRDRQIPGATRESDDPLRAETYAAEKLRALGAAMAASGAVALYHVEGVTPEARAGAALIPDAETIVVESLADGYAALNSPVDEIDLVSIGCPHASLEEIAEIARWLDSKQVASRLWITTARQTKERAAELGLVERIEVAGGRVVADTCTVVAPIEMLGIRTLATNSAKMAFYAPTHSHVLVRFGPLEQCLEAAVSGRWQ